MNTLSQILQSRNEFIKKMGMQPDVLIMKYETYEKIPPQLHGPYLFGTPIEINDDINEAAIFRCTGRIKLS